MEQLDQNKKRENLQKEKNQIFRLLPRVDDLMKKENVQRLAENVHMHWSWQRKKDMSVFSEQSEILWRI